MKKIVYTLCSILYALPVLAGEDCMSQKNAPMNEIGLQKVIELGLCRNPSTAAAYLSVKAARANKNAEYASYLPNISASAQTNRSYRNKQWGDWEHGASISASYLIFDFGKRLADLNSLTAVWRATGFDYSESIQHYVYDLVAGYYGLLTADAELKVSQDLVKIAEEAKRTADKKFAAGSVAKADVLKANTTLASRQLDLQRAQGSREIANGRLLSLLSFPQGDKLKISDMPAEFGAGAESKNIEELLTVAKSRRPDLISAEENTNAAWHRRNAAFLQRLPSISATGSISYNTDDLSGNYDFQKVSGSIGIRASMPLFAGFSHIYNERARQAEYERAQENERAKQDNAALDVWSAFQNYKTAQQVLKQSVSLLASAAESERAVAGMYKVGRATMLDWQTAQGEFASARKQNVAAKYDLFVKRAALALAIGEIKEGIEK